MKYTYFFNQKPIEKRELDHLLTERFSLMKINHPAPNTLAFIYVDQDNDDEIKILRKNHTLEAKPSLGEPTEQKYQFFLNESPIEREHFERLIDDCFGLHHMKIIDHERSEFIYRHLTNADQLRILRAGKPIKIS